jgi:hypothetical protein
MRSPGGNVSLQNLMVLDEPVEAGLEAMLGSLPCLSTMREESAFGYMTKVTLVPWSTGHAVRPFLDWMVGEGRFELPTHEAPAFRVQARSECQPSTARDGREMTPSEAVPVCPS